MSASDRPVIGLPVSPTAGGNPYYNLNPEYTDTIRRAGGDRCKTRDALAAKDSTRGITGPIRFDASGGQP